jgi:nanoRNase/pAp phosphatase (c-di-AMP/oligoRNAs hydrolase)
MHKHAISSIHEKNRVIQNIIDVMIRRDHFLVLGHQSPDEDCVASMVAFALLLSKLNKDVRLCTTKDLNNHFQYLINICRYNSINVDQNCETIGGPLDTLVICDTPKRSMIEAGSDVNLLLYSPEILKIEIDHHIGGDSEYIGDSGYCLVTEASSSSELIGHLAFKMNSRKELLKQYQIQNLFTRNVVLSILTGIIGDSQMGQFLKSGREKRYYRIFSNIFNKLLVQETVNEKNFSNMNEIFKELKNNSSKEQECFNYLVKKKRFTPSIGYVVLSVDDMSFLRHLCDNEMIVSVSRAVANALADESKRFSLIVYPDDPQVSDLIQFRMRRSHSYSEFDLRRVLELFSIENGGGHEGAIGFRIPKKEVEDLEGFVTVLLNGIETAVREKIHRSK